MSSAVDTEAEVIENEEILPGVRRMVLEAPEAVRMAVPGQFAMLEPSGDRFPVTRRPLTLSGVDRGRGTASFVFEVVGRGTALLAGRSAGSTVRMLAPLGRGYEPVDGRWLLVGGGMGTAGFPFLLSEFTCGGMLVGASRADRVACCPDWAEVATEDGSRGTAGLVTDLLARTDWHAWDAVAVCGPLAMMKAVVLAAPSGVLERIQVSMESRMGCGWGVCGGCAVPASGGGYLSCCIDGPVFRATELDWGAM